MSDKSKIEWTDATWNPVTGCSKVSEGCRNCYALTFAERWRGTPGHYFENGFDVTLRTGKLDQPLRWKRPRRIFVNSMSDLFHQDVPDDFIHQVWETMAGAPQHIFQILTKRPERMRDWVHRHGNVIGTEKPALSNVWLGISVENQRAADERIPLLLQTPAAVRFLSCEPLLGNVELERWLLTCEGCGNKGSTAYALSEPGTSLCADACIKFGEGPSLDWVIVGGESGPKARPMHPEWARNIRDQCQTAGVPFFFKQWGEWAQTHDLRCNEPGIKGKPWHTIDPDTSLCRIGKAAAGRVLDRRTWDEFPEVQG